MGRFLVSSKLYEDGKDGYSHHSNSMAKRFVSSSTHKSFSILTTDDSVGRFLAIIDDLDPHRLPKGEDFIVEELIAHFHHSRPLRSILRKENADAGLTAINSGKILVRVLGSDKPIRNAALTLILKDKNDNVSTVDCVTNTQGNASFSFDASQWQAAAVYAQPSHGFWGMVVKAPAPEISVICPPLPLSGPLYWWHENSGIRNYDGSRGSSVHVGVIDTGCGPNTNLTNVHNLGSYINGSHSEIGDDVSDHGTYICGIIAAHPKEPGFPAGVSPGATVSSIRVYDPPGDTCNQGDVALAIDSLSRDHRADLINLSLYSDTPSEIEHDAICAALECGTLCIAAAGNGNGPLAWPGAFEEAVSVSAIGLDGWGPIGGVDNLFKPTDGKQIGDSGLYFSDISRFGPSLTCAGFGIGVISTVPENGKVPYPYRADSGTSCSAAVVSGVLADILSKSDEYLSLPRKVSRASHARSLLVAHARSLGLDRSFQGVGIPQILKSILGEGNRSGNI